MRALLFSVMLLTACDDDAQPPANADLSVTADLSASSDLSAPHGDLSIAPDLEHPSGLDVDAGTLAISKTGPSYTGPHTSPAFGGVCPDETLEPNGDPSQAVNVPTLMVDAVAPKITRLAICPEGAHDLDVLRVEVPNGSSSLLVEAFYDIATGDLDVGLLDAAGTLVASDGTAQSNACVSTAITPGTYYVAITGANNQDANRYDLRVRAFSTAHPCP